MDSKIPQITNFASVILIKHDLDIYLSKRLTPFMKDKYQCVGGKINKNETPEQCAIREIKEETNLTIQEKRLNYLKTFVYHNEEKRTIHIDIMYYIFLTENEKPQHTEPEKQTEWIAYPIDGLQFCNQGYNYDYSIEPFGKLTNSMQNSIFELPIISLDYRDIQYDSKIFGNMSIGRKINEDQRTSLKQLINKDTRRLTLLKTELNKFLDGDEDTIMKLFYNQQQNIEDESMIKIKRFQNKLNRSQD